MNKQTQRMVGCLIAIVALIALAAPSLTKPVFQLKPAT